MKALTLFLGLMLSIAPTTGFAASYSIADAMQILAEQFGGLNDLANQDPASSTAGQLKRAQSRCRGAALVLASLDENKGAVKTIAAPAPGATAKVFEPGTLTPEKATGKDLAETQDILEKYSAALKATSAAFLEVELELEVQLNETTRDFTDLKASMTRLTQAMRNAHKAFR